MNPPTATPTVYFYRKHGCHLCDDMARGLAEFRREQGAGVDFEIVPRDIETNPQWWRRYRAYVPVLVMGGREICHYFLDTDELKAALSGGEAAR